MLHTPSSSRFDGLRPWSSEIAALIAAVAFLLAMVGVLISFNGKPILETGIVTLNALIAILSTASKAMLLYVVANAVSQWNWVFFTARRHQLLDFERVVEASRGSLGSLKLLFNFGFGSGSNRALVRFGAFLTIVAIALDPFAQQILQVERGLTYHVDEKSATSIPLATRYSQGNRYSVLSAVTSRETWFAAQQLLPVDN
ncbi:hypothetical protein jhhlp_004947 [Lomentospora prolificans]|uniref:Uncharacterized protein n=1 Tax=Lomentospora prolificans TaxID=41688 RepID=A0A2N3N7Y0_9PEZI|nr:hypothetical protein jhhlp_004947 [Lomentospora prolificans]